MGWCHFPFGSGYYMDLRVGGEMITFSGGEDP